MGASHRRAAHLLASRRRPVWASRVDRFALGSAHSLPQSHARDALARAASSGPCSAASSCHTDRRSDPAVTLPTLRSCR
uniref:Uncharacterized protein n=1 Tax=Arundo donax TaxID=35708 RepID=A0A0A9BIQ1_ARUDO